MNVNHGFIISGTYEKMKKQAQMKNVIKIRKTAEILGKWQKFQEERKKLEGKKEKLVENREKF